MAGYAAELQAQIAEKERRKRLQRQNSLRESQDLLAQRMAVPSGLVRLTFAVFRPEHTRHVSSATWHCCSACLIVLNTSGAKPVALQSSLSRHTSSVMRCDHRC